MTDTAPKTMSAPETVTTEPAAEAVSLLADPADVQICSHCRFRFVADNDGRCPRCNVLLSEVKPTPAVPTGTAGVNYKSAATVEVAQSDSSSMENAGKSVGNNDAKETNIVQSQLPSPEEEAAKAKAEQELLDAAAKLTEMNAGAVAGARITP